MSWMAILMRLPKNLTMSEISEQYSADWKPPVIGTVNSIHNSFKELFPSASHWTDETDYESVQFSYKDKSGTGEVSSIDVVCRGTDHSIKVIQSVCKKFDLRMVDCQSGEITDFESETKKSMKEFREFRDRNM